MTTRVIPRLDIKGPNLVKGVHLEGLRVLGKPEGFARRYYRQGADELIYQDTVASLYGRNKILDLVRRTAQEIFIPLTVGGGLRSVEDVREVLRAGADKVAINTAAIHNPDLVTQVAQEFGSSTIVVSIEAKRRSDGTAEAFTENGREPSGRNVVEWAREAEQRGAGEVLLTSVDRDGTGLGYDNELVEEVSSSISIPVIAHGGAGTPSDVVEVVRDGQADAVGMASIFHYDFVRSERHLEIEKRREGNIEHLKDRGGEAPQDVDPHPLTEIKTTLRENGIPTREIVGTYA